MSYMERRTTAARNVAPARPVSRVRVIEEQEQMTRADQRLDRDLSSRHAVAMRDLQREVEVRAGEIAGAGVVAVSAIKARRQFNYEAKQELMRARKESQILAGDDLELLAKFSLMDDDLFQAARLLGLDLD